MSLEEGVMPRLEHTVAVVTGASRGAGRGIALVLGEAGATVYVTGRSNRGGQRTEDLPGTIDETAEAALTRHVRGRGAGAFYRQSAGRAFDFSQTESPEYVGRAVAALAADPHIR